MHEGKQKIDKVVYSLDELPNLVVLESNLTGIVVAVPKQTMEFFLSQRIYALNPYWEYSKLLEVNEVLQIAKCLQLLGVGLECKVDDKLIKKVARYVLIYAENIQLMNFLTASESMIIQNDRKGETLRDFLSYALPFLMSIRSIYDQIQKEPKPELLAKMLILCIQNGINPF